MSPLNTVETRIDVSSLVAVSPGAQRFRGIMNRPLTLHPEHNAAKLATNFNEVARMNPALQALQEAETREGSELKRNNPSLELPTEIGELIEFFGSNLSHSVVWIEKLAGKKIEVYARWLMRQLFGEAKDKDGPAMAVAANLIMDEALALEGQAVDANAALRANSSIERILTALRQFIAAEILRLEEKLKAEAAALYQVEEAIGQAPADMALAQGYAQTIKDRIRLLTPKIEQLRGLFDQMSELLWHQLQSVQTIAERAATAPTAPSPYVQSMAL